MINLITCDTTKELLAKRSVSYGLCLLSEVHCKVLSPLGSVKIKIFIPISIDALLLPVISMKIAMIEKQTPQFGVIATLLFRVK